MDFILKDFAFLGADSQLRILMEFGEVLQANYIKYQRQSKNLGRMKRGESCKPDHIP
jgi:hypothetical protein